MNDTGILWRNFCMKFFIKTQILLSVSLHFKSLYDKLV